MLMGGEGNGGERKRVNEKREIPNPPREGEKIKELKHDKCGERLSHMKTTAKRTNYGPLQVVIHSISANLNI